MIERVIEGRTGSGLRNFVAEEALKFATPKELPIVVITPWYLFEEWQKLLPTAERETHLKFREKPPAKRDCLYVVEVHPAVLGHISSVLIHSEDLVWVMNYAIHRK